MNEPCPLCHFDETTNYFEDKDRSYLKCTRCDLVFVIENDLLSYDDEVSNYSQHENNKEDPGYQNFLNKLLDPLDKFLKPSSSGIDYGCGPGPTISYLLEKKGHKVNDYDPYFANHPEFLEKHYDFLTCSEVLEHVFWPKTDFLKMLSLVKNEGALAIMTQFLEDDVDFASWWYKNDPTHVRFYSKKTFQFLGHKYLKRVSFHGNSVVIFY